MDSAALEGRIVDLAGKPIVGAWVTASTLPSVTTDQEGRYSVPMAGSPQDVHVQNPNLSASATRHFHYRDVSQGAELVLDGYVSEELEYAGVEGSIEGPDPLATAGGWVITEVHAVTRDGAERMGWTLNAPSPSPFIKSFTLRHPEPVEAELVVVRYEVSSGMSLVRFIAAAHVPGVQLTSGATTQVGRITLQPLPDWQQPVVLRGPTWAKDAGATVVLRLASGGAAELIEASIPLGSATLPLPDVSFADVEVRIAASGDQGFSEVQVPTPRPATGSLSIGLPSTPVLVGPADGAAAQTSDALTWSTTFEKPTCALHVLNASLDRLALVIPAPTSVSLVQQEVHSIRLQEPGTYQWYVHCVDGLDDLYAPGSKAALRALLTGDSHPPASASASWKFSFAP